MQKQLLKFAVVVIVLLLVPAVVWAATTVAIWDGQTFDLDGDGLADIYKWGNVDAINGARITNLQTMAFEDLTYDYAITQSYPNVSIPCGGFAGDTYLIKTSSGAYVRYQRQDMCGPVNTFKFDVWYPFVTTDNRLNAHPAAPAAAYCLDGGVEVYGYLADGTIGLVLSASTETINGVGVPGARTQLDANGRFLLNRLPDGFFELIVSPGRDPAETYTFVWDGCPMSHSTTHVYDTLSGATRFWAQQ